MASEKLITVRVMYKNTSINRRTVIENAKDLLAVIALLRQKKYLFKTTGLFNQLSGEINIFVNKLKHQGFSKEQISDTTYLICSALDEACMQNQNSIINHKSLISHYYNEELSGENFYKVMENLHNNEPRNVQAIRLGYLLMCLGFLGKYGINKNGLIEYEQIKLKARTGGIKYEPIQSLFIRDTSGEKTKFKITWSRLLILSTFVVILFYFSLNISLKSKSEAVYEFIINFSQTKWP